MLDYNGIIALGKPVPIGLIERMIKYRLNLLKGNK
jgi:hypothetical protein